ncbi:hypothetical protein L2E82_50614 [Cichorium intybus]|nr:hypothetical protein L2E82_50614 [Cichorium intybus]
MKDKSAIVGFPSPIIRLSPSQAINQSESSTPLFNAFSILEACSSDVTDIPSTSVPLPHSGTPSLSSPEDFDPDADDLIGEDNSIEVDSDDDGLHPPPSFHMTHIGAWNTRGLCKPSHQKALRDLIRDQNLHICASLETRASFHNLPLICSRTFGSWSWSSNGLFSPRGTRIVVAWDPLAIDMILIDLNDQVMHFKVNIRDSNKSFFCSFVYAHNDHMMRRSLWHSLAVHKNVVRDAPWIILGDFNVALDIKDSTSGSSGISRAMEDFRDCVNLMEMEDLNYKGLFYTWTKSPNGSGGILKKIDRVMGNTYFVASFPSSTVNFLPYRSSDHTPAVLSLPQRAPFQPKPFKFPNFLTYKEDFKQIVASSWNPNITGYRMYKVFKNLKNLKVPIRKMLRNQGNLFSKVISLRNELDRVQIALDRDPFNKDLREEQCRYLLAYNEASLDEERFLKQKSKVNWLREGDKNSAFFHKAVKSRKSRNRINSIQDVHGNWISGNDLPNLFVSHFQAFLGSAQPSTAIRDPSSLFSNKLSPLQSNAMLTPVTDAEVKCVLFQMGDDKAPGSDGFSAKFFKSAWDIVGPDFCMAVKEFFYSGKLLKSFNSTILALIPKVDSPSKVTDFRPIACW